MSVTPSVRLVTMRSLRDCRFATQEPIFPGCLLPPRARTPALRAPQPAAAARPTSSLIWTFRAFRARRLSSWRSVKVTKAEGCRAKNAREFRESPRESGTAPAPNPARPCPDSAGPPARNQPRRLPGTLRPWPDPAVTLCIHSQTTYGCKAAVDCSGRAVVSLYQYAICLADASSVPPPQRRSAPGSAACPVPPSCQAQPTYPAPPTCQ